MSKRTISLVVIILLSFVILSQLSSLALARNGWDYFVSNEYDKATRAFQEELRTKETPESLYGFALSCLRYGQLNAKLYQQTLMLESRYYKLLLALEGEDVKHSNYTPYYLGVNQLRLGRYD